MNSWETQNVERKLFSDQTGRASNWAISNGYDYAAEVQTLSLEKLSNFIRSLSKILKNEDEIVWNSIDSYVWADDGFYEFEEVLSLTAIVSVIVSVHVALFTFAKTTFNVTCKKFDIVIFPSFVF